MLISAICEASSEEGLLIEEKFHLTCSSFTPVKAERAQPCVTHSMSSFACSVP